MHILVYTTQGRRNVLGRGVKCCTTLVFEKDIIAYIFDLQYLLSNELFQPNCLMDCHATNRGLIPGGDGVKSSFTYFAWDSKRGRRL